MIPNLVVFSHATYVGASGATAAATYSFFTSGYQPPSQDRAVDSDTVINQNGRFKYLYDNGPGFRRWAPFEVRCENQFQVQLAADAATQFAHLIEMWYHPGMLGMQAPEGTYIVHWSESLEKNFRVFPQFNASQIENAVTVQFEEGQ